MKQNIREEIERAIDSDENTDMLLERLAIEFKIDEDTLAEYIELIVEEVQQVDEMKQAQDEMMEEYADDEYE